jgi:hypothetical protein
MLIFDDDSARDLDRPPPPRARTGLEGKRNTHYRMARPAPVVALKCDERGGSALDRLAAQLSMTQDRES